MIEEIYNRLDNTYVNFYGAQDFQFKVGSLTLEVYVENGKVEVKPALAPAHMSILPIARVRFVTRNLPYNTFDGYSLVDLQGEEWLRFGVDMQGELVFESFYEHMQVLLDNIIQG